MCKDSETNLNFKMPKELFDQNTPTITSVPCVKCCITISWKNNIIIQTRSVCIVKEWYDYKIFTQHWNFVDKPHSWWWWSYDTLISHRELLGLIVFVGQCLKSYIVKAFIVTHVIICTRDAYLKKKTSDEYISYGYLK